MPSERTAQFYGELPSPSDESVQTLQGYVAPTLDQAAANFSLGFGTLLKVSNKPITTTFFKKLVFLRLVLESCSFLMAVKQNL